MSARVQTGSALVTVCLVLPLELAELGQLNTQAMTKRAFRTKLLKQVVGLAEGVLIEVTATKQFSPTTLDLLFCKQSQLLGFGFGSKQMRLKKSRVDPKSCHPMIRGYHNPPPKVNAKNGRNSQKPSAAANTARGPGNGTRSTTRYQPRTHLTRPGLPEQRRPT